MSTDVDMQADGPAVAAPATTNGHASVPMDEGEQKQAPAASATSTSATASTTAVPSSAAFATADIPPNQTLYVNNINEKIKKDELKKTLYLIFSAYGNIVEINCSQTYRLRGQAWIVFDQLNSATRAQRELQNFLFFGKPLRITFAKTKSDTLARLDGTYQQRSKRKKPSEIDATKPKKGGPVQKKQKSAATAEGGDKKRRKLDDGAAAATTTAPVAAPAQPAHAVSLEPPPPPHRILFIENLPAQASDLMLSMLFQQYPGYKEARVIPGKNVAFVEFQETFQAGTAMEALQGFKITATNLMKITFAKQ